MALVLTVRFEDLRQRHSMDSAGDLSAAAIRALARAGSIRATRRDGGLARNDRGVHWGLTPLSSSGVLGYLVDLGSAEDHLAKLFGRSARSDSCFGTQWPLRLTQTPSANLDLLPTT
jgi:hypothetical protein